MSQCPDVPCAGCGKLLWRGRGSLPPGEATCLVCRRRRSGVSCAGGCGRMLATSKWSLPAGERTCRECRRASPRPYGNRPQQIRPAGDTPCPICGTLFLPRISGSGGMTRTCSRTCGQTLRHLPDNPDPELIRELLRIRADPAMAYASHRAKDRLRCARRRSHTAVALVEIVDPDVVFERDGWRCHICRKRINRKLTGQDAMGPTIDHLVPISEGGEHSYANVRTAHRRCNSRKCAGHVPGGEQLALLG
jgi:hypothetical protein